MPVKVMVVDDELPIRKMLRKFLSGKGYKVTEARDGNKALVAYEKERSDLVLLDIRMPGLNGLEVLQTIHKQAPETVIIMTTAVNDVATAVEAMKFGAYDYLTKPINLDQLCATMERACERFALKQEVGRLRAIHQEQLAVGEVVMVNPSMKRIFNLVKVLGQADRAMVLITGETGTGKEIVARSIYLSSPRSDKPMVVVNCGAIPKDLMEAELLGYAKGAFTGAAKEGKKGKVELAHRGTLFLDEVGELPPSAQTVLLRILDGQPFYPVGSNREVSVDVRVIASTNRDLEAEVAEGNFREDLFYRLNVAHIKLPPLRERPDDIIPLAESFLVEFNQKYGKAFQGFSREAASRLKNYQWRGNVRELKNVIERMVLYEDDSKVRPEHLSFLRPRLTERGSVFVLPDEGIDIENHYRDLIVQALDKAQGNKSRTARLLGISVPTLRYRMEKYSLKDQ